MGCIPSGELKGEPGTRTEANLADRKTSVGIRGGFWLCAYFGRPHHSWDLQRKACGQRKHRRPWWPCEPSLPPVHWPSLLAAEKCQSDTWAKRECQWLDSSSQISRHWNYIQAWREWVLPFWTWNLHCQHSTSWNFKVGLIDGFSETMERFVLCSSLRSRDCYLLFGG